MFSRSGNLPRSLQFCEKAQLRFALKALVLLGLVISSAALISTGVEALGLAGSLRPQRGEDNFSSSVFDPVNGFAYFKTSTSPRTNALASYVAPLSSGVQDAGYVLHVIVPEAWSAALCGLPGISYSGDYSGTVPPPDNDYNAFDIGPVPSPFTVTLTAGSGFTCHPGIPYVFDHWTLDGLNMGSKLSLEVTVDESHMQRLAEAHYLAIISLNIADSPDRYPTNGETVFPPNPVTLMVRVNAMPAESGWVSGVTVNIYVDDTQACSGTSDIDGWYMCDYQLNNLGHTYSWYATASKSGYGSGTSSTWTFTYKQSGSFFHPATVFWFSRYDMLNAQWDAIHIVNVGTATAFVSIDCGSFMDSLDLNAGQTIYRTYSSMACGPVHIISSQPIWVTQRILGWTAMQEIYGMPGDVASTDIIFTWYDLVNAQTDDIYVINPGVVDRVASVDLYVAGALKGHIDVLSGQELVTSFKGMIGGPLRISSNVPVFASQRVIGFNDFAEVIGLPSWYTFTETWFNWYDMQYASWDAIHMLNPGTSAANVQIYVAGTLRASLTLAAGAADYRIFQGLMGGPVRVMSDQPIWVTQRVVGWGGWKEVFGVPTTLAKTEWYMTWYDMQYAQWDAIHIINPGATDATVQIYVGGVLKSTITVGAGKAAYVTYPGLVTGPVRIVSTVPVTSSQRILGWGSFEETIGASLAS